VGDSLALRQCCRLYAHRVPDDTAMIRWANRIRPTTLAALDDRAVELAHARRVPRGRKLRVDATVVETTIRHPSDRGVLGDGVRVPSRPRRRAETVLGTTGELGRGTSRTRARSVRRIARRPHRVARRQGEAAVAAPKAAYRRLAGVAQQTCR